MAGNADVIIALDQQRMEATVKQDFATLESSIADDLIYTHSTAWICSAAAASTLAWMVCGRLEPRVRQAASPSRANSCSTLRTV